MPRHSWFGFYGGINPVTGELHISIFSERAPIPTSTVHQLNENGTLGDELPEKREGRDGVVRVVQDTIYMDLATTLALQDWLSQRLAAFYAANPGVTIEVKNGR